MLKLNTLIVTAVLGAFALGGSMIAFIVAPFLVIAASPILLWVYLSDRSISPPKLVKRKALAFENLFRDKIHSTTILPGAPKEIEEEPTRYIYYE